MLAAAGQEQGMVNKRCLHCNRLKYFEVVFARVPSRALLACVCGVDLLVLAQPGS